MTSNRLESQSTEGAGSRADQRTPRCMMPPQICSISSRCAPEDPNNSQWRRVGCDVSDLRRVVRALGVEPGARVAAQVDKSTDMIVLARAGAELLPLNTAYTLAELEYFLGDAEPALTICRPDSLEAVRALARKLSLPAVESLGTALDGTFAEQIAAAPAEFETVPRSPDDLAAILYTSGTTGRSKGAVLTHKNLSSNALTLMNCWRFTSDDRLIHALPVFHAMGSLPQPMSRFCLARR
jgi:acyl-CoA synthetase (AMP-forming)/AMP-acid ligase II